MNAPASAAWEAHAERAFAGAGHRAGGARRAIVELLAAEDCCLSAQEICERLRGSGREVGIASVYRVLDALSAMRLVQRIDAGSGAARYERLLPDGDHHHHAVCDRCGALTPFDDPHLERAIESLAGRLRYTVRGHDVVVHGYCPACRR